MAFYDHRIIDNYDNLCIVKNKIFHSTSNSA